MELLHTRTLSAASSTPVSGIRIVSGGFALPPCLTLDQWECIPLSVVLLLVCLYACAFHCQLYAWSGNHCLRLSCCMLYCWPLGMPECWTILGMLEYTGHTGRWACWTRAPISSSYWLPQPTNSHTRTSLDHTDTNTNTNTVLTRTLPADKFP